MQTTHISVAGQDRTVAYQARTNGLGRPVVTIRTDALDADKVVSVTEGPNGPRVLVNDTYLKDGNLMSQNRCVTPGSTVTAADFKTAEEVSKALLNNREFQGVAAKFNVDLTRLSPHPPAGSNPPVVKIKSTLSL